MDVYSFQQLLNQLPDCENLFVLRECTEATPVEIRYIREDETVKSFIPPNLPVIEQGSSPVESQIVIISAPGAVGKTTLSKSIAAEKRAILYDLASARPVGGASLNGTLFNALGGENSDQFAEYLNEGLQFVIIDALDEGRIRVTEDAFTSFLQDIRNRAQHATGICFVLLGRTQIAEEAWLTLDEERSSALLLTIEPFSRSQAEDYINGKIEDGIRTPVLYECRDLIFEQLAFSTGIASEDESREFLHYPPVLDVIADLLIGETNPQILRNELQAKSSTLGNESLDLLYNVIGRILLREQKEKLLPAIRSALGDRIAQVGLVNWDQLCTPIEQSRRLLGRVLDVPVSAVPAPLPDEFRDQYEEIVGEWLPQHSFVQGIDRFANSVFQSYLFAKALRGDFGEELKQRTTAELLAPENLAARNRLLAEFYLSGGTDTIQRIEPEHLGILYDSLLSSETTRSHLRLTIDGTDPSDMLDVEFNETVEGEFEFLTFTSQGKLQSEPRIIPFEMEINSDSQISFTRSIRDCNISLSCSIELGSNNAREFELGSATYISSYKLKFSSESLKVGGKRRLRPDERDESNVILEAMECDDTALINRPTVYDSDRFFVSWPNAEHYPWTEFCSEELQNEFGDENALHTTYMRFKRIATAFRSRGHGTLAKTARKIDDQRVLQGAVGEALRDRLVSDEVLSRVSGIYHWNSATADMLLGVSWQDLRKGECPQSLRDYLTKFIEEQANLFG